MTPLGLVCQNCFAHSVLVLMALSTALSNFVKGRIVLYTRLLNSFSFYIFWCATYNRSSKQILIFILTDGVYKYHTYSIRHKIKTLQMKPFKIVYRGCTSQMFFKVSLLWNTPIFTGKQLCWTLFLITFQAFRPATLLKSGSNTGVFLWILRIF